MDLFFSIELIESILYVYRATRDPALIDMGVDILTSIEVSARTPCGFATVNIFVFIYCYIHLR